MNYTEEDKYEIVIQLIKDPSQLEHLISKYKLSQSTLYKWRTRFLEGGKSELANYKTGPKIKYKASPEEKELKKKLTLYEDKLALLATENEILKKKENWTKGPLL